MLSEQSRAFLERVGYDADLERSALQRLAEHDPSGCRRALGALVGGIDASSLDGDAPVLIQLLVDILHSVNRRVHGYPGTEGTYLANRLAIIDRFAVCRSFGEARRRFLPALNALLAPFHGRTGSQHPLATRARSFIDDNFHRRLSLSDVAERLAVSPSYLSRVFRRETGTTLTEYIQRTRIDRSLVLLAHGAASISEIAYQVGYQNYRDFYRNFVKQENASPSHVRARLRRERRPESDRLS
jgi:two-component system response regulator YesN